MPSNLARRQQAYEVREAAADTAKNRVHPTHVANVDETKFRGDGGAPNYLASFTKGLPHDRLTGLIKSPDDFQQFIRGIDSGAPRDFIDTPLGCRFESRPAPLQARKAGARRARRRPSRRPGRSH